MDNKDSKLEIKIENGYITPESMIAVMKKMSVLGTKDFEAMQDKNRKARRDVAKDMTSYAQQIAYFVNGFSEVCNTTLESILTSTKKIGLVEWNQSMYFYMMKRNQEVFNEQYAMLDKFKKSVTVKKKLTKEETEKFLKAYQFGIDNFGINFKNAVKFFKNLDVAQMMIDFKVLDTIYAEHGFEIEDLLAALEEFKDEKELVELKAKIDKALVDMKVLPQEFRKCNHDHSSEGGPDNSHHGHQHSQNCGHDHSHEHGHGHSHSHEETKEGEHKHDENCQHHHHGEGNVQKTEEKVQEKVEEKVLEKKEESSTEVSDNVSEMSSTTTESVGEENKVTESKAQ